MLTSTSTYQIGDAKITRVTELLLTKLTPNALYPQWDAAMLDEHGHWLKRGTLNESGELVQLSIHSWVVELGGHTLLIDTGVGNHKHRPFIPMFDQLQTPFLQRLEAAGVRPDKVDHVLLTHLHADHVGWNTQWVDGQWLPMFNNAKYVFPEAEQRFFSTPESESRRQVFEDSVLPIIAAKQDVAIGERGAEYLDGIRFLPTPGHSAGHMSISIRSRGEEALFTGDVMHSPIQVYRPQWNSVFCADAAGAEASRRWLLEYAADRRATLFSAHFPETSAGVVSREGDAFSWAYC